MRFEVVHLVLGGLIGSMIGLGLYTFVYAKGYSYLSNDPKGCANCHVMEDNYSAWLTSSHHTVATCNDCHAPHDLVGKYAVKATNGFFHSLAFTTGGFPDVIQIKGLNERVAEGACKYCHADLISSIVGVHSGKDISCIKCHSDVGHSAAPVSFTSVSPVSSETGTPSSEESKNGKSEQP